MVRGEKFFLVTAILMVVVIVAGFSLQLGMGRSSFASPVPVHLHAVIFFGWAMLYLLQNALAATGSLALHRRLGWLSIGWIPAMVAMGMFVTAAIVRRGSVPFFFQPLYFLIMDWLTVLTFAGLASAAILLRKRTQTHRRLMYCGMALLTGPGFGRLLPMLFFIPHAGWVVFAAVMLFPIAGVIRDLRRSGRIPGAWWWGIGAMIVAQVATDLLAESRAGLILYEAATRGTPGAAITPMAFPPFPH